ncbi:MAG: PLP-dependent aminotransferase family protein [Piscirickettsiaceae bacterium]|nr:PLP-dependent aminotransferase family protein [Piscirickettsiaceae bacterium]
MSSWKPRIEQSARLKYLGIVEALEADIYAGYVNTGDRLPSQRTIAEELSVDLTTVTRAFNEARRRGLIDAKAGRGTFIKEGVESKIISRDSEDNPPLDLSMNNPPQPEKANLQQRIPDGIASLISGARQMLQLHYQDSAGSPHDREAAATWLRKKITDVSAERILITGGAQAALFAIAKCLIKPGETIAAGEFSYPGLKSVAEQLDFNLTPLAMDDGGIIPESFEQCCQLHRPKALYVIPAIDNPTTATLSTERRKAIAEIARRFNVSIIEDDPYTSLQSNPFPPIANMAPELTWHISTLSKCVTPALRIAYVIAPSSAEALSLSAVLRAISVMASPLMSALVSRWIYDGTIDDIATAIRDENVKRQTLAKKLLAGYTFSTDVEGHHLWLTLPNNWHADDFVAQASRLGVSIVPSSIFAIGDRTTQAVRISLGLTPDIQTLNALSILAKLMLQSSLTPRAIV